MFYFLIFFVFLEVLHCCLHIWRRSSLLQSLQTGFGRELSHLESDVGFWGFLWPLLWMCLLHTFWSLLKGIRKIICFVSIPQSQASAESLPFVFSRVVPWNTEVCEPFPNSIVMLAFSTCLLAICKGSVSPSIRAHAKIRPMWVSGLGLGKAYRVLRVTVSQLRGSESEQSPVACGKPSWWVSINRFIASLWSSEPWFMCSHSLSQPLSLTDHFSNVGDKGQKWVSWAVSCLAGKARYSHFCGWNCRLQGSLLAPTLMEGWRKQSENVPLTLINASILKTFFLAPMVCWNFSAGLPGSYKGTLVCEWLPKSISWEGMTVENSYSTILQTSIWSILDLEPRYLIIIQC